MYFSLQLQEADSKAAHYYAEVRQLLVVCVTTFTKKILQHDGASLSVYSLGHSSAVSLKKVHLYIGKKLTFFPVICAT